MSDFIAYHHKQACVYDRPMPAELDDYTYQANSCLIDLDA